MESQQNNIALYAAIKTFHSEGNDIWGTVSALTLLTIEDNSSPETVKTSFNNYYDIEIPSDTLKTILSRLKKDGLITDEKSNILLTSQGKDRKLSLDDSVKKIRREYSSLHEDFKKYLDKEKITGISQVDSALLGFIDDNIGFASEIITSSPKKQTRTIPASAIAKYIIHIEKSEPKLFEIFQNIFFGRLYLTLMKTRTETDAKAKFDNLVVLLDTNVLLSLLGLHDDSLGVTANELLQILKSHGSKITVSVLDITVEESISVLHAYAQDKTEYTNHIKVDSGSYRMRLKKIDKKDLNLLIETIDEKIDELGISVTSSTVIDTDKLQDTCADISRISRGIEQEKNANALQHDGLVIENIKSRRIGTRSALLEKSKAVFVTQDRSLIGYAQEATARNHKFLLAIRPVDIISLLWIKSLGSNENNVSGKFLRHAVMGYARERLIDNGLWNSFVQKMDEAKQKGSISDSDINFIMASDETERLLSTNNKKVVNNILNQTYIDKLRAEHEDLISAKSKNATRINELGIKLTESETKSKEIERENTAIDLRLKSIAKIIGVIIMTILGILITALIATLLYKMLIHYGLEVLANIAGIGVIVLAVGWAIIIGTEFKPAAPVIKFRKFVQRKIENRVYGLLRKFFIG